jgi:hypothetical protein
VSEKMFIRSLRELLIEALMTHHCTPIRMVQIQNPHHQKLMKMWSNGNSDFLLVGETQSGNCTALLEDSWVVSYRVKHTVHKIQQPPSLVFTQISENWMLIALLLIIAPNWKQLWCSSVCEWVNTLVHPGSGILFSTKKEWTVKSWKDMEET